MTYDLRHFALGTALSPTNAGLATVGSTKILMATCTVLREPLHLPFPRKRSHSADFAHEMVKE